MKEYLGAPTQDGTIANESEIHCVPFVIGVLGLDRALGLSYVCGVDIEMVGLSYVRAAYVRIILLSLRTSLRGTSIAALGQIASFFGARQPLATGLAPTTAKGEINWFIASTTDTPISVLTVSSYIAGLQRKDSVNFLASIL